MDDTYHSERYCKNIRNDSEEDKRSKHDRRYSVEE